MKKRVINNALLFILIFYLLDFIIGNILRHYYFTQSSGYLFRTTYAIDSTKADIIVFGSSRANHHYVPNIFKDSLKMTFYNAGCDGQSIFYHLAVLKAILKRYSPKIIILDFFGKYDYEQKYYDRLSSLLPYYKTHKEIRPIINLRSKYERYKVISEIYPFNSKLTSIIIGNLSFNKKRKSDFLGYVALNKVYKGKLKKYDFVDYKVDLIKFKSFINFVALAKQSKVKIYIVFSPIYFRIDKLKEIELANQVCSKYDVPFIDFSKDTTFLDNPSLFQDEVHLNKFGAEKFSVKLVKIIKEYCN